MTLFWKCSTVKMGSVAFQQFSMGTFLSWLTVLSQPEYLCNWFSTKRKKFGIAQDAEVEDASLVYKINGV